MDEDGWCSLTAVMHALGNRWELIEVHYTARESVRRRDGSPRFELTYQLHCSGLAFVRCACTCVCMHVRSCVLAFVHAYVRLHVRVCVCSLSLCFFLSVLLCLFVSVCVSASLFLYLYVRLSLSLSLRVCSGVLLSFPFWLSLVSYRPCVFANRSVCLLA